MPEPTEGLSALKGHRAHWGGNWGVCLQLGDTKYPQNTVHKMVHARTNTPGTPPKNPRFVLQMLHGWQKPSPALLTLFGLIFIALGGYLLVQSTPVVYGPSPPPGHLHEDLLLQTRTSLGAMVALSATPPPVVTLAPPSSPPLPITSPHSLAVVAQGPASQDYTLKLLTSFAADSPTGCGGAAICIFSTWSTEANLPISLAYKAANFTLVLTDPPENPGWHNVNLQLLTSHAGIVAARRMGATHAIKMRGDIHLNRPTTFIQEVVGFPAKLTMVSWIRYMTDYLVAGPIDALEELFSPIQPPGDDHFAELFIASQFIGLKNMTMVEFCRSLAFWVDKEGNPVGGAHALPKDMLYWNKFGPPTPTSDMSMALRGMVTPNDPCLNQLPPGCHNAC